MINKENLFDFPILSESPRNKRMVYLDSAATSQKPRLVIDAITEYYSKYNSNAHRGVHYLAEASTNILELSRHKVKNFINAGYDEEIIFTKGTTEAINLVANSLDINEGDEIIVTEMEHHANLVPWQLVAKKTKAVIKCINITEDCQLDISTYERLISKKTKIVSLTHVSNVLGTINPIKKIIDIAHKYGALVLIDGAQAIPHIRINVSELDCDFYCFSAHKMYGPMGIGVLYGKRNILEKMEPYQGGGGMIQEVDIEKSTYAPLPYKFEAGTQNIANIHALSKAIDFIEQVTYEKISNHEKPLLEYAIAELKNIKNLRIISGPINNITGVISFVIENVHPHDIGTILDSEAIAIRVGHHCAQPLMKKLGLNATARISLACHNNKDDINRLVEGLHKVTKLMI